MRINTQQNFLRLIFTIVCGVTAFFFLDFSVYAKETTSNVSGSIYEFEENVQYVLDSATSCNTTNNDNTIGQFSVAGDFTVNTTSDGLYIYTVSEGNLTLTYSYDMTSISTDNTDWCLCSDKTKKVNGLKLESNILYGALLLQTSLDGESWITEEIENNTSIFVEDSSFSQSFYSTKDIQLQNGCYYRILVVYKMSLEKEKSWLLSSKYDYKRVAEVYEFYASYFVFGFSATDTPRKTLGQKINAGKDTGYSETNAITSDDPHYGWTLGEFFINGYTRETTTTAGETVFLKNVGDTITLWFSLEQDITCLNGNSKLSISDDSNGYDQYFEIEKTDFGRGTLIIQYTDEEGVKHDPIIYTDFLAANTRTGADTRVQLFEEGDYEVALDYEIADTSGILTSYTNYRITFKFSVRNGNCMVYPFDLSTGSELSDGAITANGFSLDMAKSKYLTIDVQRSVLTLGADGQLIEDVRFNKPAKDGDQYTSDGIYTFTVKNLYTGESTTKTIYVGSDMYLKALSSTSYTIEELNALLAEGASVNADGTIDTPDLELEEEIIEEADEGFVEEELTEETSTSLAEIQEQEDTLDEATPISETESETKEETSQKWIILLTAIAVAILTVVFVFRRRTDPHSVHQGE